MLERIALHQTRLRTPGLGLDGKGVALGSKGLILLPSIDRLVAFFAVYTRERSLEDLLPSLQIDLVRSKLGTRELTLTFAAESSDRMDKLSETAHLVGGFVFTGTSRHFVQYRDSQAPFGYDTAELLASDAPIVLYHDKFTQVYGTEKPVDLRALILRLSPHVDPTTAREEGPRFLLAERGLGPALIHYFVRSQVEGEVGMAEWPPESAFDDEPVRRYLFSVPNLPVRMRPLLSATPGITTFMPAGPGIAVESGFRHPITLRACPLFEPQGLVLVRGNGKEPLIVPRVPQLGDVRAFARVHLLGEESGAPTAVRTLPADPVRVPLRLVSSSAPRRNVTAAWLTGDDLALLRKLAYALPRDTLERARVATTDAGTFIRCPGGIEAIPLGMFYIEVRPGLYMPAGTEFVPAVHPEVLYRGLGSPTGKAVFVRHDTRAFAIDEQAFVPLATVLLESAPLAEADAQYVAEALTLEPIDVRVHSLGMFPLSEAQAGANEDPPLLGA